VFDILNLKQNYKLATDHIFVFYYQDFNVQNKCHVMH
jgi:hypothetical protein